MKRWNPDMRPKALLYLITAVVLIMALAVPWASADDAAPADATDANAEQAEPSPTPIVEPEPEETVEPEPEETVEPEPEETVEPEPTEPVEEPETPEAETPETDGPAELDEEALEPATDTKRTQPNAPPNNNGTVKVDGTDFDSHPDNQPKPGCSFEIDYTGFDPSQAFSHSFTIQSGDGNGTVLASLSGNLNGSGAGSFSHNLAAALAPFDPKDDGYYHVKLNVSLPGVPGGSKHKTFKVLCGSPPDEEGFVIVEKEVLTANAPATNFGFTGDLGTFSLGDGDSEGPVSVPAGSISVTESLTPAQEGAGWSLDSFVCEETDPGSGEVDSSTTSSTATFDVEDGQTITCTFKNEYTEQQEQARVIIAKDVTTLGAPDEDFDFTGDFGNFSLGDGDDTGEMVVAPGNFDVTELLSDQQESDGWKFEDVSCVDLNVNRFSRRGVFPTSTHPHSFDVEDGETVKCTFENVYEPDSPRESGIVVVKKKVVGDSPLGPQTFSFDGTLGSFDLGDGDSEVFQVQPGDYTVEEDLTGLGLGWSLTSATCVEKGTTAGNGESTVQGAHASIDLSDGETVTCTYTNDYTAVEAEIEKKPPPKVLGDIIIRERLGTTIRRAPLPFTGSQGLAPLWIGLLLIAGGALTLRVARKR